MLTDTYVEPEGERDRKDSKGNSIPKLEKYVITPRMFKHTVAKGSVEFSGGKQQDAAEYFDWLMKVAEQEERIGLKRAADRGTGIGDAPITNLFSFYTQDKLTCSVTSQVRLMKPSKEGMLLLLFPDDITDAAGARKRGPGAASQEEGKEGADGKEAKRAKTDDAPLLTVPLDLLLGKYTADETMAYTNPSVGRLCPRLRMRFRSSRSTS